MGKFYAKRIISGKCTIDDVGKLWYDKTIAAFKLMVEEGKITEEEYKEYTKLDYEPTSV